MSARHEVDLINQGVLTPEGGAFPELPTPDSETVHAEQIMIRHELDMLRVEKGILDCFASENRSVGNIQSKTGILHDLTEEGIVNTPRTQRLGKAIEDSKRAVTERKREAKELVAYRLGIPTERRQTMSAMGEKLTVVAAKDPAQQARLDSEYRSMRLVYATTRNARRRDRRREDLKRQIASRESGLQPPATV